MSEKKLPAKSLGVGISVLKQMVGAGHPQGLTQIAAALDLSKSSTHDLLHALHELGFVEQDTETKKYLISPGIFSFIHDFAYHYGPNAKVNIAMQKEAERLKCGVYVHVISGKSVFLVCAAGRYAPTSSLGVEVPVFASSAGKVLVAQKPEDEWPDYAPEAGATPFTKKTVISPEQFLKQVRQARELGTAWNEGEHALDFCSVAAPILEPGKISTRSVALVFAEKEWRIQDRPTLASEVKKLADLFAQQIHPAF